MTDPPAVPKGLYCPSCRGVRLTVLITHKRRVAGTYVRYRECSACGCRFRTKEVVVHVTRRASRKPVD